jgi:hypothetical protein
VDTDYSEHNSPLRIKVCELFVHRMILQPVWVQWPVINPPTVTGITATNSSISWVGNNPIHCPPLLGINQ